MARGKEFISVYKYNVKVREQFRLQVINVDENNFLIANLFKYRYLVMPIAMLNGEGILLACKLLYKLMAFSAFFYCFIYQFYYLSSSFKSFLFLFLAPDELHQWNKLGFSGEIL